MRAGRFVRLALGACALSSFAATAFAASYEEARDAFEVAYDRQQRLMAQVLLSAAGYPEAVPTGSLSRGTYEAIKSFEAQNGYAASGLLDRQQLVALAVAASPALRLWGFRTIPYPGRTVGIWVPVGLGLTAEPAGDGLRFRDARGRLTLEMVSVGGQSIQAAHAARMAEAMRRSATIDSDDFSEGDPWFALSSEWHDGSRHYVCLYRDAAGVIGFSMAWRDNAESVEAKRLAPIMTGSLRAAVSGEPFADPPTFAKAIEPRGDDR